MNTIELQQTLPEVFAGRDGINSDVWHRQVNFQRGKSYLIEATSGTGKSSLCSYIYGYRNDYQGIICFDGNNIRNFSVEQWVDLRKTSLSMLFQELQDTDRYDAVWACSSILHLTYDDLISVLEKIARALKDKGLLYTSFKYGTEEGERNGRYFTDMTEEKLTGLLEKVPDFEIEEQWITSDVRPGRGEEKWLNLFLRKK